MENLSRSFSKRSYGGNGFGTAASHKSVYDDVFGGPPKFGMPTLAPRLEDYGEIFGGFHSARGSSVPVLDLPVVDEAELCFDARSSRFDYSEVFGGFDGLDFAMSFDDFVRKSDGRDDSSDDDAWSPAESESPSGYIDPYAFADRSESLINEDTYHQTCVSEQFETPYNKTEPRSNKKISNLATHEAQLHAIPGNTYNLEENHSSQKVEVSTVRAASDLKSNKGFDGGPSVEKKEKTIFLPAKFGFRRQVSDCSPVEKYSGSPFSKNKPFVTVNDFNLRTKPSQLPPPSRPPPVYASKEGASVKLNSRQKSARSSFEEAEGNPSPPFYDVEVDGSSSMLASATMGDDMEKAQVNIRSAKESIEKKVVLQSCSMLQPQTYVKTVEENENKTSESISSYKDDRKVKCANEGSGTVPFTGERSKVFKDQDVSDFVEKERYNDFAERSTKGREGRDGQESGLPYQISQKSAQAFAWRQETEYFEVFEAGVPLEAVELHKDDFELVQKDSDEFRNWVANEAFEQKEEVKDFKSAKVAPKLDQRKNKLEVATDGCGDRMRSATVSDSSYHIVFQKIAEVDLNSCESDMNNLKIKMPNEHEEIKRQQNDSQTGMHVLEGNHNPRGIYEKTGSGKMLGDAFARKTNERKLKGNLEIEGCDARHGEDIEREKNKKREIIVDERKKQEEYPEKEKNKKRHKEVRERKENENMPKEVFEFEGNEKWPTECNDHQKNPKKSFEQQGNKKSQELDSSGLAFLEVDIAESSTTTSESRNRIPFEAFGHQELKGPVKDAEQINRDVKSRTEKVDQVAHLTMERKSISTFDGTDKLNNESYTVPLSGEFDKSFTKLETTQVAISHGEDEDLKSEFKETQHGIDVGVANCLVEETPHSVNQNEFQHGKCENGTVDSMNSSCVQQGGSDSNEADIGIGNSSVRLDKKVTERPFEPDHTKVTANEPGQRVKKTNGGQRTFSHEISKDNIKSHQPCVELSENGNVTQTALPAVLGDKETQLNSGKKCIQNVGGKEKSLNETLAQENNKIEERLQKERELEMENLRKLEEEKEREREREKDRMAVNRAALETRDRLYVEARERAERAAVERATAEARQRAVAEAREKLERLSMEARERSLADKASVEARHKAERAAVERATLEARQRAFEKTMADRVSSEGRERVGRSVSDKFISSRTDEMRQSSSFSNSGTLNPLRYSYSSVHVGNESESPQRCKARLERFRRTAERAAKALEEKNLRDLVAQREQAERNRLAETLDAEVKRWSSGKEANLRALLSTLQYILGPESGWQPIPLTEVITSAAVKKAYRKATLCVHPDKLQQRGASIQQKYICEKVFDLLKEAWSTFNSEER